MTGVWRRFICIQASQDTLHGKGWLAQNRQGVRWDAGGVRMMRGVVMVAMIMVLVVMVTMLWSCGSR